jgi:hypothetical protein
MLRALVDHGPDHYLFAMIVGSISIEATPTEAAAVGVTVHS